jgi:hypothetical protein
LGGDIRDYFDGEIEDVKLYNTDISAPRPSSYVPPQVVTEGLSVNSVNLHETISPASPVGIGEAVFTGTVIPGSLPPSWYFEYGLTPTSGYRIPAGPGYGAQTTSGMVSAATPTNPTGPGVIIPYRVWFYRLVATDRTATVYGKSLPFVPGGLINPPGLQLTNINGRPAKYRLTIECKASPCQALATHDGTARKSIKVVQGELLIGQFNPSTGGFTGTATLIGGIFAPEVLTNTLRPGYLYNGAFGVTGSVANSVALLKFSLVRDVNPAPQVDFQCGNAAVLVKCGIGNFTLAGDVTYGGQSTAGYAIEMRGQPGGAGNKWELCWVNQNTCSPVTSYSKQAAGSISQDVGWLSLVPSKLSVPLAVFSTVMSLIHSDPPDPRYTHVAPSGKIGLSRIAAGHGMSRRAAAAATELLTGLTQASIKGAAFLNAIQRYQGALHANSNLWVSRQAQAALKYGHQLVAACHRILAILKAQKRVLSTSSLNKQHESARKIESLLRAGRHQGLPRTVIRELERLGVEPASIRKSSKTMHPQVPRSGGSLLGPILRPSFAGQLRALATAVDGYTEGLEQHPPG